MNLLRIIFSALLGFLSSSIFVLANEAKVLANDSPVKQYIVTFHNEATAADFNEISQWITENKGEIVESINENFAKLIIAKSGDYILKLSELKPELIESVEEDDLDWDEHAEL